MFKNFFYSFPIATLLPDMLKCFTSTDETITDVSRSARTRETSDSVFADGCRMTTPVVHGTLVDICADIVTLAKCTESQLRRNLKLSTFKEKVAGLIEIATWVLLSNANPLPASETNTDFYTCAVNSISAVSRLTHTRPTSCRVCASGLRVTTSVVYCTLVDICVCATDRRGACN